MDHRRLEDIYRPERQHPRQQDDPQQRQQHQQHEGLPGHHGQHGHHGHQGYQQHGYQQQSPQHHQQGSQGNPDDRVAANDLLLASKGAVRSYAAAITEAASPQVRDVLQRQLNDVISFQSQVADYMVNRGYYDPHDVRRQVQMDMDTARNITQTYR